MTNIPVLQTERLRLRGWNDADFDAYAEIFCDPETTRFISKLPTRQDAWRNMAMVVGHWDLRGYGAWAVERLSDGVLIADRLLESPRLAGAGVDLGNRQSLLEKGLCHGGCPCRP